MVFFMGGEFLGHLSDFSFLRTVYSVGLLSYWVFEKCDGLLK